MTYKYKLILFNKKKTLLIISLVLLSLIALFEVFDRHHSDHVTFSDSRLQLIKDLISDPNNFYRAYFYLAVLIGIVILLLIGLVFNNYFCGLFVALLFAETTRQSIFNVFDPIYNENYFVNYLYWYIGVMSVMSIVAVWFAYDLYIMRKEDNENRVIRTFLDKVQVVFMNNSRERILQR